MDNKEYLTNEGISKKFNSSFELVNYAIRLAENMIQSGRGPRVRSESNNKALLVIEEIEQDVDQFDEIAKEVHQDVLEESKYFKRADELMTDPEKQKSEKRKTRKMNALA